MDWRAYHRKGVGNGISIVLLINIISGMPSDFVTLYSTFVANKSIARGVTVAVIIAAIVIAVVVLVVILQDGERRIPVQYSQKVAGRKNNWWSGYKYSFKGKYSRCYANYLCFINYAVPCNHRSVVYK